MFTENSENEPYNTGAHFSVQHFNCGSASLITLHVTWRKFQKCVLAWSPKIALTVANVF